MPTARVKRYRPTELAELSDAEIVRMLRRGQDPARGLDRFHVSTILNRAIQKLSARPEMLRVLARAIAARRELERAERAARGLATGADGWRGSGQSFPASAQLY